MFDFLNIKLLHKILLCFWIFSLSGCDDMEQKNKIARKPQAAVDKIVDFAGIPIDVNKAAWSSIPVSSRDYQHFILIETTAEEKAKLYELLRENKAVKFTKEDSFGMFVPPWFDINTFPEGYTKHPRVDSVGFDVYGVPGDSVISIDTGVFNLPYTYIVELNEPNSLLLIHTTQ